MPYTTPYGGSVSVELSDGGLYAIPSGGAVVIELATSSSSLTSYVTSDSLVYISTTAPSVGLSHSPPTVVAPITAHVPFAGLLHYVEAIGYVNISALPPSQKRTHTVSGATNITATANAPTTLTGKISSATVAATVLTAALQPTHKITLRVARSIKYSTFATSVTDPGVMAITAHNPTQHIPVRAQASFVYWIWKVLYDSEALAYTFSVTSSATTPYSIRQSVYKSGDIRYSVALRDTVSRGISAVYSMPLCTSAQFRYSLVANTIVRAATSFSYSYRYEVRKAATYSYTLIQTLPVARAAIVLYTLVQTVPISRGAEVGYSLLENIYVRVGASAVYDVKENVAVVSAKTVPYSMQDTLTASALVEYSVLPYNELRKAFKAVWSVPAAVAPVAIDAGIYLEVAGTRVDIVEGDISLSEGEYAWSGNFVLAGIEDYARFSQLDEFDAVLYGEVFKFVVVGKELNRQSPGSISCRLICSSPTIRLEAPTATGKDKVWEEDTLVTDAIGEVLQGYAVPVTWAVVDWVIPKYRLAFTDATPIDVLSTLSRVAGGILLPGLDGSLRVQYKYPVSIPDYATATPIHYFTEVSDILTASEEFSIPEVYDKFRLLDTDANVGDNLEWVADEADPYSGIIRAYPYPWRDVSLTHTGASSVTIDLGYTDAFTTYEELVEVYEGKASTQHPVYDLLDVQWEATDLHGLAFTRYTRDIVVTGTAYNGLVRLRYSSLSRDFRVSSSEGRPVQFLLESYSLT